jgi:hypothetical protein
VQLKDDAFQVKQDVDDVFAHAVERRVLVDDTCDLRLGRRIPNHRRQQNATQCISERVPVAALERLHRDDCGVMPDRFNFDRARF